MEPVEGEHEMHVIGYLFVEKCSMLGGKKSVALRG